MSTDLPACRYLRSSVYSAVLLLVSVFAVAIPAEPAAAQSEIIVVDSADDRADANLNDGQCRTSAGTCSLRAAIGHANATNGPNTINFAIPGGGVRTISVGSSLPSINDSTGPLTIDGYSQPGAAVNTLAAGSNAKIMIQVSGSNSVDPMFEMRTPANVIRGLAAYGARVVFRVEGEQADGNRILGNFIGTDSQGAYENPIGVSGADTGVGVLLQLGASQNVIGTPDLADRNVISGNGGYAMRINHGSSHENLVQNNVVGLRPLLNGKLRQWHGIDLQWWTWGNLIGGYEPGEGNLVGGMSHRPGIELSHAATGNHVVGNLVGTLGDGNSVSDFSGNIYGIGLKDDPRFNYIAHNVVGGNGHGIWAKHNYNTGNMFVDNRIGLGVSGASIPNTTGNVLMTGVEEQWYGNVVVGRDEAQMSVTNFNSGGGDANFRPELTGRNRITQGQFLPGVANRALAGQASQSSTGFNGSASRAIDGNTDGVYNNGSVTHTNSQANAWWTVDLGANSSVDRVVLHNRTDCCIGRLSNFSVFVSSQPFGNRSFEQLLAASDVWHTSVDALSGSTITLQPGTIGRYVRVQLAGSGYLSLAEVEVYGPATTSSFPPIDIAPDGLDINDPGDGDQGIQSKLNYPEVTGIGPGKVFGNACSSCLVDVYTSGPIGLDGTINTDGAEPGSGLAWIGSARADGAGAFSLADSRIAPGRTLSATAIDGNNNTSELPPGQVVPSSHSGVNGAAASAAQPFAAPTPPAMPRRYDYGDESSIAGQVIDLADVGVAGLRIDLFDEGRANWQASTVTDANGGYSFPVSAGCYVVTFIAPDGTGFSTGQFLNRSICVASEEEAAVNATLRINGSGSPTSLGGSVANSAGDPVGDVEATLFLSDDSRARLSFVGASTSDTAGQFSFTALDAGCYVTTLRAPTDQTFVESGSEWLNLFGCVQDGETGTVGSATVNIQGSTDAVIGGTLSEPAGSAPGIQLDLYTMAGDGSRGSYLRSTSSVANGTFVFEVNAGCYVVTYIAQQGRTWVDSGNRWLERAVCVDSTESNLELDAQLN